MSISIQRESGEYLYHQVVSMVLEMQRSGSLRAGDKLPSLRGLSTKLDVSVPTVRQAYIELERQGVISARPKSGYFLKAKILEVAAPKKARPPCKPKLVERQSLIEDVFDAIHAPGFIPFGVANPSAAYSSDKALARAMRRVLSRAGAKAVECGPIDGFFPLKRQLALRYIDCGMQVDPEEVMITNGGQEAIAIALQCVAKAGDVIAVESPTYFGVLELIESLGMMALEIPLCSERGLSMKDLQSALDKHCVSACVFSSSISNPLGSSMSDQRREALVGLLEARNIPLIEDDVYGDLYFGKQRGRPAKAFSRKGLVLTCSSFSKTAAPGYRIGWLLPGKYQARANLMKRALSCSSPLLNQWALSEFMASGEYERNLRMLRSVLQKNKQKAIASISQWFPDGTRISDPKGGGVLWVELPRSNDGTELFHKALGHNISITPGALFSPSDKFKHCIRLSYGIDWSGKIEDGIKTLGSLVVP